MMAAVTALRVKCWYCRAVRWRWLMACGSGGGAWQCRKEPGCRRRYARVSDNGWR